jgi:hypothetical protein
MLFAGKIRSNSSSLLSRVPRRAALLGVAYGAVLMAGPLLITSPVAAATAAAATPPLTVVGGEEARTLVLRMCTANPKRSGTAPEALASESCRTTEKNHSGATVTTKPKPVLVGSLTLDVTNTSSKAQKVTVYYRRDDGATAELPGTYSYVYLAVAGSPGSRSFTIGPHVTAALPLHFTLTPHRPSSALEGTLYIGLHNYSQAIAVPVEVSVPAPPGLRLESGELTLSNDRPGDLPTTTLTLVGPGAAVFAGAVDTRSSFVLHDAKNHEAMVDLSDFKEVTPGVASAKLSLANDPAPGAYKGELTLFPLSPGAPRLTLKVNSHLPVWITILCVLAGVLFGDVALRLYALNQRRDTLFRALRDVLRRFQFAEKELHSRKVGQIIWSLDDLAEKDSLPRPQSTSRKPGSLPWVEALFVKINEARNDRDLDQDTDAVLEVVARIQRWLRLAPGAWLLDKAVVECPPEDADKNEIASWHKTATWRDTRLLQECLLREPPDAHAADDLVARVMWQVQWYRNVAHLYAEAQAHPAWHSPLGTLENQLSKKKSVLERTAAERDELSFALERLGEELDAELPLGGPSQWPDDRVKPRESPELTVEWGTTPNLFTGWATIDGTSMRNLRARASERGRVRTPKSLKAAELATLLQAPAEPPPSWREKLRWCILKAFFDMVSLVAASVFYAVTIYTETWGSLTDVLTALTAGFAGKVLIDYGTLSIFQSRLLSAAGKETAQPAGKVSTPSTSTPTSPTGASTSSTSRPTP